jgi:hypothetical protein
LPGSSPPTYNQFPLDDGSDFSAFCAVIGITLVPINKNIIPKTKPFFNQFVFRIILSAPLNNRFSYDLLSCGFI